MENSLTPEATPQLKTVPVLPLHTEQLPSGSVLTPSGQIVPIRTGATLPLRQADPKDIDDSKLSLMKHSENLPNGVASTTILEAAKMYSTVGLSVIPVRPNDKRPVCNWKAYQSQIADTECLETWFAGTTNEIGIVAGQVSGNLELIDFDEKYNIEAESIFERWKELVDKRSPQLVDSLILQKTRNNGFHIIYGCKTIGQNVKLASRAAIESEEQDEPNMHSFTLIETRGEGGYFMCAPSNGYGLLRGSFSDIPEISPEQRDILISSARALNEYVPSSRIVCGLDQKATTKEDLRPGDDFNDRGDITDLLLDSGWKKSYERKGQEYWCRPGKQVGVSATYHLKLKTFYVFSSNARPFENDQWYTKFAVYAFLKHGGNFKAATKELAQAGYGKAEPAAFRGSILMKVENYLGEHYDFRINVVNQRLEFRAKTGDDFKLLEELDLNTLIRELNHHSLIIPFTNLKRLLESDYSIVVDPIKEYFDSLPDWDRTTDFIASLSETVTLKYKEDRATLIKCLKRWLIGQVACALDANETNHTAIIFVGIQGIGKSSWLNRLIPPSLSRFGFIGTINPDNKDALIYMSEKMLINLDELETLNKTDIGSLKTIMTQSTISVRRPYATYPMEMPRRASFVGSINKDEFLKDPTGSRRFLTFDVTAVDYRHSIDMNAVYGQAFSLFKSGEPYWFNTEENAEISSRNQKHMQKTYEHELLIQSFERGLDGDVNSSWKTTSEIAAELAERHGANYRVDHASISRLGQALTSEGFPCRRIHGGIKQYCIQRVEGV